MPSAALITEINKGIAKKAIPLCFFTSILLLFCFYFTAFVSAFASQSAAFTDQLKVAVNFIGSVTPATVIFIGTFL